MQNWFLSAARNFLRISPWHLFIINFCRLLLTQFVQVIHHSKENCPIDWKDFCLMVLPKLQMKKTCQTSNNRFWPSVIKIVFLDMILMLFFCAVFILYSIGWEGSKCVLDSLSSWLVVVLLMNILKMNFLFWKFLSSHLHTLWDTCFVSSFQTGTIWKPI